MEVASIVDAAPATVPAGMVVAVEEDDLLPPLAYDDAVKAFPPELHAIPSTAALSAYAQGAPPLIRMRYSTIRIREGEKRPYGNEWQRYCRTPATPVEVAEWSRGRFGIGIACGTIVNGLQVVAVDLDLEGDELDLTLAALPSSPMEKFGRKGLTRFFLCDPNRRGRAYTRPRTDGRRGNETLVDFKADGGQVVVPPTLHPDTGRSYFWTAGPVAACELPVLTADDLERFEDTLRHLGWDGKAAVPDKVEPLADAEGGDGEESIWQEVNRRAFANIPTWAPSLGLYRGAWVGDRYEAVPIWRDGGSGNPPGLRKRSLKIHRTGICDFGTGEGFSPLGLVRQALNLADLNAAYVWLSDRLGLKAIDDGMFDDDAIIKSGEARAKLVEALKEDEAVAAIMTKLASAITWDDRVANKARTMPWLVKGLLPANGVSILWGQSGAGKSFVALELAACVMTGQPFFEHRTKAPGGVLFALGEGGGTMPDRMEALKRARFNDVAPTSPTTGEPMDLNHLPVAWVPVSNLDKPAPWRAFADHVREVAADMEARHGCSLRLVIIDTIVAAFGFAEDPDAASATRAMKAMDDLAQELGILFLPIHHAGKSKAAGEHGSYAWRGSAETSLEVEADRDQATGAVTGRRIFLKKNRHGGNEGWNRPFELREVELGRDEDGDAITSAIVVPFEGGAGANDNVPEMLMTGGAKRFMKSMKPVFDGTHFVLPSEDGAASVEVAYVANVRAQYLADNRDKKDSTARQAFRRDMVSAKTAGVIDFNGDGENEVVWYVASETAAA